MQKTGRQLEVFDGGVEGLFRYYRARRMLASCLLLPVAVALLHVQQEWSKYLLVLIAMELLGRYKSGMNSMIDLTVYAASGSRKDKGGRVWALMKEDARHQIGGVVFVALTTVALLAWARHAGEASASIRQGTDLLFLYVFVFVAALAFQLSIVDLSAKHHWGHGVAVFMFMLASIALLHLFDLGLAARLALTMAPLLPALLAVQRWRQAGARRDELFEQAARCCLFTLQWVFIASFLIWMRPAHLFEEIPQSLTGYSPAAGMWATFWPLLPLAAAANLGVAFMRTERIKRGFCHAHPYLMKKERLRPKALRRHLARTCKPLLGTARHWRRVRRVTLLGERPWPAALLSAAAAAYFLFG